MRPFFRITLLLALLGPPAIAADTPPFERRDLRTQHPIMQDAVSIQLGEGKARHLLVVTSPDAREVVVLLFSPDAQGKPGDRAERLELPADVIGFDVARVGTGEDSREALYFLTPDAVLRFDPTSRSLRRMRAVRSIYRRPVPGRLLTPDFMRDAGSETAPRVVLPDFDGVHVGRTFLPVAPRTTHDERGTTYRPTSIQIADLDLDGKDDVFLISDDAMQVFHGRGSGFSPVAVTRPLGLDVGRELSPQEIGEVDQSNLTTRRVVALEDFDDDGLVDLLIESTHRSGVLDRETSHELHLARRDKGGISFSREPTTDVRGDAPIDGVRTVDIDGDGRRDLATASVDFGLGTIISALLTGSIDIDVYFFRLDAEGHYPREPNASHEARIEFDLSQGRASIPVFLLADVNGDGAQDLVVREDEGELLVYPGDGSEELFADDAHEITLPLPENGQLVSVANLNGDASDDLIVRYGRLDGQDAKRTLILLLGSAPPSLEPDTTQ